MEKWMPHGPSGHLRTGMLLSVLFVAVVLRIYNLNIVEPQMPVLTADALEYKIYGQYLVSGDYEKPLADRPPAFPLVLGLLYSVLEVEGNKAWPQRLLTVLFDIATCAMLYAVVERICGGWTALLAAALYASNGELIRNSLLASTEQFYMLVSLAIFYGFQRLSKSPLRWSFVLIATGCAFLILTKQEGFLIIGAHFIFAIFSIRRFDIASHRGQWLGIAGAVITSITAYASYKYYSAYMLQIPTMNYRTGNALFHAEFLSYRLPWGYMRDLRNEYFRMSNVDWLLNYHSLEQVLSIVADSTLLVFIYFGEMLGAIPLIALVVASVYLLWREGQLQLPFLLSLSLLPFCFLAEPHSQSSYTPRLLVPAMPYALSLLAIFSLWLVRQVKVRWGALTALCCGMGMLVLYAVLNLGAVHALGINPAVRHVLLKKGDGEFTRPSFDLDEKINEGMWWQIRKDYDRSRAAFHAVLEYYPNYAPAHLGLAYNDLAQGSLNEGKEHIGTAILSSPYFAEAYVAQIAIALKEQRYAGALSSANSCAQFRPDYAPCQLLLGHLLFDYKNDYVGAVAAYENYNRLNLSAHKNYLDFINKRLDNDRESQILQRIKQDILSVLNSPEGALMTPLTWFYVHRGKGGGLSQRVKPEDRTFFYCAGLAYEQNGERVKAEKMYENGLALNPRAIPIRSRLQQLRKGETAIGLKKSLNIGADLYRADLLWVQLIRGDYSLQYASATREQ